MRIVETISDYLKTGLKNPDELLFEVQKIINDGNRGDTNPSKRQIEKVYGLIERHLEPYENNLLFCLLHLEQIISRTTEYRDQRYYNMLKAR